MSQEKKRRPNWTKDECLFLAELVKSRKSLLEGKFSASVTSAKRQEAWEKVTQELNASSSISRNKDEVEKKWKNMKAQSKKTVSSFSSATTATGGGPPPIPLSPVTDAVVDVVGRDNVTFTGIPGGCDTTLLQLQFSNDMDENSTPVFVETMTAPTAGPSTRSIPAAAAFNTTPEVESLLKEKINLEIECLKLKRKYYLKKITQLEE